MNRLKVVISTALFPGLLVGCGSNESTEPVEQIVVREPGQTETPADTSGNDDGANLVAKGKAAFAACVACHVIEEGAASSVGPNLYGVVDRAAGSVAGFNYSENLKNAGITWTKAELDDYIANPTEKVPGTTMVAGAVSDGNSREAIIAYLTSLTDK